MNFKKMFSVSFLGFLLFSGCGQATNDITSTQQITIPQPAQQKIKVVTSFYPLYELVQKIGGDKVDVTSLVPSGVEPHDFEPSPQQIDSLYKAKLVVLNGAGIEPWGEKVKQDLEDSGIKVLVMADSLNLLEVQDVQQKNEATNTLYDPHFWLDPIIYLEEGKSVLQTLIQFDPANKSTYEKNFAVYSIQLQNLADDYDRSLKNCTSRTLVTSHAAFTYLSKRYNLSPLPISGLSPEQEPSAKSLSFLANIVKTEGILYVFTETLASPKMAQTLADEAGAKTLVLNPLEGLSDDDIKASKNYVSVMKENLENLKLGLGCK